MAQLDRSSQRCSDTGNRFLELETPYSTLPYWFWKGGELGFFGSQWNVVIWRLLHVFEQL